ncbi:MAG TPA: type II secretion system F family protein [Candidatus Ozemobacteraceae bacterium]|nr:type II secretion system F family protein [Candidatus Ozemobacteraceae bacterium]
MSITGPDLKMAFITYFNPRERNRLQNESLGLFAINLSSGIPLLNALDVSRRAMPWPAYRRAMNSLYENLTRGRTLIEALKHSACAALPLFARVLLASDLTDIEKGNLMQLQYAKADSDNLAMAGEFVYPVTQLAFLLQICIAMVMFVLPQFKEIFMGLHVPLPRATALLMDISDFLVSRWFLVMPVGAFLFLITVFVLKRPFFRGLGRRILGTHQNDFAEILRILEGVDPDRVERVVRTFAFSLILPESTGVASEFADALGSGQPADAVLVRHGFDPQAAWIIRLAIEGKGTREGFGLAADMILAKSNGTAKRRLILVNTLIPLALSLFVGGVLISVFLPMINLLEHI